MHYLSVRVSCGFPCFKLQSEAKVGDAGRQVVLQQHVLALDVPERQQEARRTVSVSHSRHLHTDRQKDRQTGRQTDVSRCLPPVGDGRLVSVLVSRDVLVQVGQAAGRRLSDVTQLVPRHHVGLQVVGQRALRGRRQDRLS